MTKFRVLLFATLVCAACSSSAQSTRQPSSADVVATVGSDPITLADVDAVALQESASSFGNARLAQALYLARRGALDQIIARRLIEQEAKARGTDAETLVRQEIDAKITAPTDADAEFWYQNNPSAVQGRPLAQLRQAIKSLLAEQRTADVHDVFVDSLKLKTPVTVSLEPPRQSVVSAGRPARGPEGAPIEIVEFSDFQCPFCQRANPTIDRVLKTYGDKVRFVYKHFPLGNHPNARPAAEAAACADAQGQFWKYHDQLFTTPDRLSDADLKRHAATLGLDVAKFNTCVDTHATKDIVDADMKEAQTLGVNATPSFFINGRSLDGAQPFESFKRMIDEELATRKR